jgi:sugar/nucleoside kinase (ribokinase family)
VCIGDVVKDYIVSGVQNFPATRESEPCRSISEHQGGMGANVAVGVSKLGGVAHLLAWMNRKDETGKWLLSRLKADIREDRVHLMAPTRHSRSGGDVPTRKCVSFVFARGMHDRGFLSPDPEFSLTLDFLRQQIDLLQSATIVHFAGVGGLPLLEDGARLSAFLKQLRRAGSGMSRRPLLCADTLPNRTALADPRWRNALCPFIQHLDYFLPSDAEVQHLTGIELPHLKGRYKRYELNARAIRAIERAVKKLRQTFKSDAVIVMKLGEHGVMYAAKNEEPILRPTTRVVDVVDMTGAGDAWCSGFIAGKLRGFTDLRACTLGNIVAAESITQEGATAGIRNIDEILRDMDESGRATSTDIDDSFDFNKTLRQMDKRSMRVLAIIAAGTTGRQQIRVAYSETFKESFSEDMARTELRKLKEMGLTRYVEGTKRSKINRDRSLSSVGEGMLRIIRDKKLI